MKAGILTVVILLAYFVLGFIFAALVAIRRRDEIDDLCSFALLWTAWPVVAMGAVLMLLIGAAWKLVQKWRGDDV